MKSVQHQDCINSLQEVYKHYERDFSIREYEIIREQLFDLPHSMTIVSKFKTWTNAKKQSGIVVTNNKKRNTKKSLKHIEVDGIEKTLKVCSQCEKPKVLDEFHLHKTGIAGRNSRCKACYNAYKRRFHHENKERMNLKNKIYYLNNKEAVLERIKKHNELTTK